jgi:hypothetical protein
MASKDNLAEARAEAQAVIALPDSDLSRMFFEQTMRRNLARTVRHLDRLVLAGGDDRVLGKSALNRLGFVVED